MLGVVDLHLLLEFLHLRSSAGARARSGSGAKAGASSANAPANAPTDTYEVPGMWREAPATAPIA